MRTLLLSSERKSAICHRMVPLQILYIMTLTFIFKFNYFLAILYYTKNCAGIDSHGPVVELSLFENSTIMYVSLEAKKSTTCTSQTCTADSIHVSLLNSDSSNADSPNSVSPSLNKTIARKITANKLRSVDSWWSAIASLVAARCN